MAENQAMSLTAYFHGVGQDEIAQYKKGNVLTVCMTWNEM